MIGVLFDRPRATSVLREGDATVETRCDDDSLCRVDVHTDDGVAAALCAAHLVRQAVVRAVRGGLQTVRMTLDVASPACGTVLTELRNLAGDGIGRLQVRRAGETVLVDVDLRATVLDECRRLPAPAAQGAARAVDPSPPRRSGSAAPTLDDVRHALGGLRAQLDGRPGICGTGIARHDDGYVLRVNVADAGVAVPGEVEGLPVDVCVTGPLTALGR